MNVKIKRLVKRFTMKKRAFRLGCAIRDRHVIGFIPPDHKKDKGWRNACRTLIRLNRIKHDIPPFSFGGTRTIGEVFECDVSMKAFGNMADA